MNGYLVYILNLSLSSVIQRVSNRPSLSFIKNVHFIFFSEKWRQQREMVSPHVVPVHVCRAHTPAIFHCNACEQVLRIKENFRRSSRGGGGHRKGGQCYPRVWISDSSSTGSGTKFGPPVLPVPTRFYYGTGTDLISYPRVPDGYLKIVILDFSTY
jgi:hypothetical protein